MTNYELVLLVVRLRDEIARLRFTLLETERYVPEIGYGQLARDLNPNMPPGRNGHPNG